MRQYLYILVSIALVACSAPEVAEVSTTTSEAAKPVKEQNFISLEPFRIDGAIALPGKASKGVEPTIILNELTGMLDIKVGKGFYIQLREEPQNLLSLKAEWDLDPVWSHTVVEEAEDFILFTKTLPDGSMEQFHFIAIQGTSDRQMVIRSSSMEEFNQEQAKRMLDSAQSFSWNENLAQSN